MLSGDLRKKRWLSIVLAVMLCATMFAGCSSGQEAEKTDAAKETEAADETAAADENAGEKNSVIKEETITASEFDAAVKNAVPYEDGVEITLHTAKGDKIKLEGSEGSPVAASKYYDASGDGVAYHSIYAGSSTSTLIRSGYDYGMGNMLDWDLDTCWAEGNPNSEGTMEGFVYYFGSSTRVDGFRIFPGYQKNRNVYRNNIEPLALNVTVGDYSFNFDMDPYMSDLPSDDAYFWVDCVFNSPVYADSMYVMISAVTTYGNDPDYDCCITEFHPFYFK